MSRIRTICCWIGLIASLGISEAQASLLSFSFADPTNDAWGCPPAAACTVPFLSISGVATDVVGLTFRFDNVSGAYLATMTASALNPFVGDINVNVNLFNGTRGEVFFSSRHMTLSASATSVTVAGLNTQLLDWDLGDFVAACNGPGGIIPEACTGGLGSAPTAFSSGVVNFLSFPAVQSARDAFQGSPPAVVVIASVPEPSVLGLVGIGFAGLAVTLGRRRLIIGMVARA